MYYVTGFVVILTWDHVMYIHHLYEFTFLCSYTCFSLSICSDSFSCRPQAYLLIKYFSYESSFFLKNIDILRSALKSFCIWHSWWFRRKQAFDQYPSSGHFFWQPYTKYAGKHSCGLLSYLAVELLLSLKELNRAHFYHSC